MVPRPVVLVDVDGPLTRGFWIHACRLLRQRGYPDAWPHRVSQWDVMRSFDVAPVVEREVADLLRRPGVASSFEPRLDARPFLDALRKWATVRAVTAPLDGSATWAFEREAWLGEHFGLSAQDVFSVRDKAAVRGDALVDDRLLYLTEWKAANPDGLAVMWVESHNTREDWVGPRATTYEDLAKVLEVLR